MVNIKETCKQKWDFEEGEGALARVNREQEMVIGVDMIKTHYKHKNPIIRAIII